MCDSDVWKAGRKQAASWYAFCLPIVLMREVIRQRGYVLFVLHIQRRTIVVGQSVPLVRQLFAASVGGCGYGGFAFSPADDLDAAMVDCDGITSVSLVRTWRERMACGGKAFPRGKCAKG